MPAGCGNTTSSPGGYDGACGGGSVTHSPQEWGDIVRKMYPGYTGHRPRVQLFHGDADTTIRYTNHTEAIDEWTNVLGLDANTGTTQTGLTLGSHQAKRQQWKNACGYVVLDAFTSIGGDHGPSDCLFIAQYVIPFLGLDKTGALDPEIEQCGGTGGGDGGVGDASGAGGVSGAGGAGDAGDAGAGGAGGRTGTAARDGGMDVGNGGSLGTGGAVGGGGRTGSGGSDVTGGVQGNGGAGSGGNMNNGGATGGVPASGGAVSSGGQVSAGGGGGFGTGSGGNAGAGVDAKSEGCSCALGKVGRPDYAAGSFLGFCLVVWGLARRKRRATH
jgi:hypothetical protein